MKIRKSIFSLILIAVILVTTVPFHVEAKNKSFKIRENGKTTTYSGQAITVMYNGKKISTSKVPVILSKGYALVAYNEVFKNKMKVSCKYTKKTKKLVLSYEGNEVSMRVGKKTAYVNGVKKKMSVAPRYIKYISSKKSRMVIPARFAAEALGFDYTWDANAGKISIVPMPEGAVKVSYNGVNQVYQDIQYEMYLGANKVNSLMPCITLNKYNYVPAKNVFPKLGINYSYKKKVITLSNSKHKVIMKIGSKYATVDGKKKNMKAAPYSVKLSNVKYKYIMVPVKKIASYFGLTYVCDIAGKKITLDVKTQTPIPTTTTAVTFPIAKPSEVVFGTTKTQDNISLSTVTANGTNTVIITNNFQVTIPGDYTAFYGANPINTGVSGVTSTVTFDGVNTVLGFKASGNCGFRLSEEASSYTMAVGKPSDLYKTVILFDPGHGGSDSGANGNGLSEKNVTLSVVRDYVKPLFDAQSDYKAYYTRLTDTLPSLAERYTMANQIGADLFFSVHCNSASDVKATGTETIYGTANQTSPSGLSSKYIASLADANLVAALGLTDRKAYEDRRGLAVLRGTTMPATLVELGFLSNSSDAAVLKNPEKLKAVGQAIYNTVDTAFKKYPTNR